MALWTVFVLGCIAVGALGRHEGGPPVGGDVGETARAEEIIDSGTGSAPGADTEAGPGVVLLGARWTRNEAKPRSPTAATRMRASKRDVS
jgi:hypothetical protein